MLDLPVPKVKSSVAAAVVTVVVTEVVTVVVTEMDSVADAVDSVEVKEEKTSVTVVAIEVTIQDLMIATILKEAEREEVATEVPEVATPLPKSDKIFG
jgi:predicted DNA-binding ArsR family transcriptional regulator